MENIISTDNKCCAHGRLWFKLLIVLAVTAIVIVSVVMALRRQEIVNQFSATASGRVFAKPDIANIMIGLKTEAKKTAAEAVKENTNKMNEVIGELKKIGVEEKDIKTTNYSLNPFYDWKDGVQALKGYEVYQNVTVKVRDLNKIGEVIAKTTEKGANQVGGINFTIDDPEELPNEAREEAIAKAKARAEAPKKVKAEPGDKAKAKPKPKAPKAAKGIVNMTVRGWTKLSNCAARIR